MLKGSGCEESNRDKADIFHLVKLYSNDVQKQSCYVPVIAYQYICK
jgi:hypothetical protein